MQIINFDRHFEAYLAAWIQAHADTYKNNVDRMEEKMPEVYMRWLNTPADWLDGHAPGTYFAQYDDAQALVAWLRAYVQQRTPVPDQLLERITDLGGSAQAHLMALLDESTPMELQLMAISLLGEMDSREPLPLYVRRIARRAAQDEFSDMATEALGAMGAHAVAPILAAIDEATDAGRESFLDILCNFPGDERIYALARDMFLTHPGRRALFASFLGKLGDARAIPVLQEAMADPALSYLDYIELRNALEALGGDAPAERAFDGDPFYESLRSLE